MHPDSGAFIVGRERVGVLADNNLLLADLEGRHERRLNRILLETISVLDGFILTLA